MEVDETDEFSVSGYCRQRVGVGTDGKRREFLSMRSWCHLEDCEWLAGIGGKYGESAIGYKDEHFVLSYADTEGLRGDRYRWAEVNAILENIGDYDFGFCHCRI